MISESVHGLVLIFRVSFHSSQPNYDIEHLRRQLLQQIKLHGRSVELSSDYDSKSTGFDPSIRYKIDM